MIRGVIHKRRIRNLVKKGGDLSFTVQKGKDLNDVVGAWQTDIAKACEVAFPRSKLTKGVITNNSNHFTGDGAFINHSRLYGLDDTLLRHFTLYAKSRMLVRFPHLKKKTGGIDVKIYCEVTDHN